MWKFYRISWVKGRKEQSRVSQTAVTLLEQIRWLSQGPLVQEVPCRLVSAQYGIYNVPCSVMPIVASVHHRENGRCWNISIVSGSPSQHHLQSILSLQIHGRIGVRVPPPPVLSRLLLGGPRSRARGRSATRRARRSRRRATTSRPGRGSSKANTWVTTKIRR